VLRIDGVRWEERPSLYRAGNARAYRSVLQADGGEIVEFGAEQGARPSTGRGNITAEYRVGGGTQGEVEAGAIDSLLGSVRGVQKVVGAGSTSGGADQDDEARIRTLAPSRARAFGRVVSLEDAVDLALAFPGVSHAAGWVGAGRPGCACGGRGPHVAFARTGVDGPREATPDEVVALRRYLDARRDLSVRLCVVAACVTELALELTLAVDPARVAKQVLAAVKAELARDGTAVSPERRRIGEPFDPSDVYGVLHAVPGVLGVLSTKLGCVSVEQLERHPAKRYELLLLSSAPLLQADAA
jgi:predicted phage baseplate assembly protein